MSERGEHLLFPEPPHKLVTVHGGRGMTSIAFKTCHSQKCLFETKKNFFPLCQVLVLPEKVNKKHLSEGHFGKHITQTSCVNVPEPRASLHTLKH